MDFKVGQVLNFAYKGNLIQKIIMWANQKHYGFKGFTHSAIIGGFVNKDGVECAIVYEALNKGFTKSYYELWWLEQRFDKGEMDVGNAKKPLHDVWKYCEKYIGTPYGWIDIFRIAKFYLFGSKVVDDDKKVQDLICSEAVARILYDASDKKIDFEKEFDIPYDYISPMDLEVSKQISWGSKSVS